MPDLVFGGSIPELYDRYLVPLIFEVYADDLVARLAGPAPADVLEVAAGTGAVTRIMAAGLPPSTAITASDLSQPMLDYAASVGTARPVRWQQADAMDLPFDDASFDAVVCQFGVMFFPDRTQGYAEVWRVLRPGGTFLFNVWDQIDNNEFAKAVQDALGAVFPDDPPTVLAQGPYGYFDVEAIRADVISGGFTGPVEVDVLEARSRAASCDVPAIGFCQGSPLRNAIEARDPARLAAATAAASETVRQRFGKTDIDGKVRAFVVTARKT
ncbi:MAG TPA: methyltransferase domain-containing protein [Acidimicrobiales bacterium]|nr:methyltransferase domain-containing protein [Acidimicrobiales bacterium]